MHIGKRCDENVLGWRASCHLGWAMRRRFTNLPAEALRSLVAIAETGSLSRAARRLGLTQPALTAQMNRLQELVGRPLVVKTSNGTALTELGQIALPQARRLLDANDQLLGLASDGGSGHSLRLGLGPWLLEPLLASAPDVLRQKVLITTGGAREICRSFVEGYLDMACVLAPRLNDLEFSECVVERRRVEMVWSRSHDAVVRRGEPMPVISMRDDDYTTVRLQKSEFPHQIVLRGADHHLCAAAAQAGLGLYAVPRGALPDGLVIVREEALPVLPVAEASICARAGLHGEITKMMLDHLMETVGVLGGTTVKSRSSVDC